MESLILREDETILKDICNLLNYVISFEYVNSPESNYYGPGFDRCTRYNARQLVKIVNNLKNCLKK